MRQIPELPHNSELLNELIRAFRKNKDRIDYTLKRNESTHPVVRGKWELRKEPNKLGKDSGFTLSGYYGCYVAFEWRYGKNGQIEALVETSLPFFPLLMKVHSANGNYENWQIVTHDCIVKMPNCSMDITVHALPFCSVQEMEVYVEMRCARKANAFGTAVKQPEQFEHISSLRNRVKLLETQMEAAAKRTRILENELEEKALDCKENQRLSREMEVQALRDKRALQLQMAEISEQKSKAETELNEKRATVEALMRSAQLSCQICLEKYSDRCAPTTLQCGHTLCKSCFQRILVHRLMRCPVCRNPSRWVTEPPTTFAILDAAKAVAELSGAGDTSTANSEAATSSERRADISYEPARSPDFFELGLQRFPMNSVAEMVMSPVPLFNAGLQWMNPDLTDSEDLEENGYYGYFEDMPPPDNEWTDEEEGFDGPMENDDLTPSRSPYPNHLYIYGQ